jgi:NADH-quinone oxidoreductase subunit E
MHETDSMVMEFSVPNTLESEIDELITHYPEKRSVTLMALHALQAHFGFVSDAGIEWIAQKLDQTPLAVLELVTFYPMFSRDPLGKFHFSICRTLSCALNGSEKIYWLSLNNLDSIKTFTKDKPRPMAVSPSNS